MNPIAWLCRKMVPATPEEEPVQEKRPKRGHIKASTVAKAGQKKPVDFRPYEPPPGVIPADKRSSAMAMDATPYEYLNTGQVYGDMPRFPGYQYLTTLAQVAEYQKAATVPAEDMTREWIGLRSTSDDKDPEKADKIKNLNDAFEKYKIRSLFKEMAEMDSKFGRGQLYINLRKPGGAIAREDPAELESKLFLSKEKIPKGSLIGFVPVEPVWTYPGTYNSNDPLAPDYYRPVDWYVMGKTVHHTRLLMFVGYPVPDLLKSSYNFGGLSMSQMMEPYVNNWHRTRDSVSDAVAAFSTSGLLMDMEEVLAGGPDDDFFARLELFNKARNNRGMMVLNKDTEEFFQFNMPLSGLSELQEQSQEHMCSIPSIPLVKFLGVTPSGLNASSDGEIKVYYDHIGGRQEVLFRDNLEIVLKIIQLSEFGEIDPDITFEFEPLDGLTEKEAAEVRKSDADTDTAYVAMGAVSPEEVRAKLQADPESGWDALEGDEIEEDDEGTDLENTVAAQGKEEGAE